MPLASSEPHAAGQAKPEMLQRSPVSGCPVLLIAARNGWIAPSSTPMAPGVTAMLMSLLMVSVAVADFVGSLLLVAVTCTVGAVGRSTGAV